LPIARSDHQKHADNGFAWVGHSACVAHYKHKKNSLCAVQHRKNHDVQKVTIVAKNEYLIALFLLQLRKEKSESAPRGERWSQRL
jgi:hypothetical protein